MSAKDEEMKVEDHTDGVDGTDQQEEETKK